MKNYILFLVICLSATISAQDLANKVPNNTPFALCFNGKNLNDKVAVKTIQEYPWMQELTEKELNFLPKDLSQTGIDLTNKQYQYFTNRDSVASYVILIPLNNVSQFEKLIQTKYGDTLKVKKEGGYNSISTSKSHHLAWNDKFAVLVNASYTLPFKNKYNETDPYADLSSMDTTGFLTDTTAVADYNSPNEISENANPAYPTEELNPTPDPETKTKSKKGKSKKGKKTKKTIEEPKIVEPTEEEIYAAQEKANAELEETNQKLLDLELKKTDSIERLKISPVVNLIFKEAFGSKTESASTKSAVFKNNNPKSDFYVFADLDLLTNTILSSTGAMSPTLMGIYKNGILNSNYHMNGYFEKDKIRLNQVITPKDEETKKAFGEMFDSKFDKNLLNHVGNNILGYYSISMETQAIMNYEYKLLKSTFNSAYQSYTKDASGNEADVLIDAVALLLDEKAIADLVPGNAVFVLHDLKTVKRDYINYTYNENYEQTETKATKDEIQPDFTFLMNTRNESFVNKLLQLPLNKSKITTLDYQMTNGYYTIHFGKDNLLENLYIGMKNGVVMLTTSKVNIENLIQQIVMPISADFKKSISKNNATVWFDIQKMISKSKTDLDKDAKSNYYDIVLKNAGEITLESKFKNGTIVSDASYTINGEHANSLEYFFNVLNDCYAESKKEKIIME
jgi:hypothetical protein